MTAGSVPRFAAVLFDCDGVLVDSAAAVERAWREWTRRRGVPFERIAGRLHGQRSADLIAAAFPELDAAAEGAGVDAAQVTDPEVTAIPGARETLLALDPGGFGVVTSGTRALATARLRAAGLPPARVLVSAEDVAAGKPDPAGYLLGAERLGQGAADLLVVEDAPAGIAAGKAAGARVAALRTTHSGEELATADWVLDGFDELRALLDLPAGVSLR
jgi:mannitol-1-/sugar-/sorbitol-6-phosphatase